MKVPRGTQNDSFDLWSGRTDVTGYHVSPLTRIYQRTEKGRRSKQHSLRGLSLSQKFGLPAGPMVNSELVIPRGIAG